QDPACRRDARGSGHKPGKSQDVHQQGGGMQMDGDHFKGTAGVSRVDEQSRMMSNPVWLGSPGWYRGCWVIQEGWAIPDDEQSRLVGQSRMVGQFRMVSGWSGNPGGLSNSG
ncbi:MAG TPA: hypothetical protein VHT34_11215, partial [Clostridia bacterium]|nr:hypothetical protein [Clostridia bacterium]